MVYTNYLIGIFYFFLLIRKKRKQKKITILVFQGITKDARSKQLLSVNRRDSMRSVCETSRQSFLPIHQTQIVSHWVFAQSCSHGLWWNCLKRPPHQLSAALTTGDRNCKFKAVYFEEELLTFHKHIDHTFYFHGSHCERSVLWEL